MPLYLDESKYPRHFFYLIMLYFVILLWSLSLSYAAYSFFEAQFMLFLMLLPAILFAVYAIKISAHLRAFRIVISVLAVIAIILSVLIGYVFLG